MSPAHVLEPTYRRLKREIMEGVWRGGVKLEAQRLADAFGVSMTPVRDSLNQLTGEGLVELTPGEGFRVPLLTEQLLRDMLEVNGALLEVANPARSTLSRDPQKLETGSDYADRLADVFSSLAGASDNGYLSSVVNHISNRLHAVRQIEAQALPGAEQIIADLERSLEAPASRRRAMISRYHRQCRQIAPQLVLRLRA